MPLTKKTSLEQMIHDFVNSTDPKFASDSKEQRIKRAQGAYYAMHKNESVTVNDLLNHLNELSAEVVRKTKEGRIADVHTSDDRVGTMGKLKKFQDLQAKRRDRLSLKKESFTVSDLLTSLNELS